MKTIYFDLMNYILCAKIFLTASRTSVKVTLQISFKVETTSSSTNDSYAASARIKNKTHKTLS